MTVTRHELNGQDGLSFFHTSRVEFQEGQVLARPLPDQVHIAQVAGQAGRRLEASCRLRVDIHIEIRTKRFNGVLVARPFAGGALKVFPLGMQRGGAIGIWLVGHMYRVLLIDQLKGDQLPGGTSG